MARKRDKDTQDETSDGSVPVNDAWTGMLAVSLLALVLGAGFLGYDWYLYSEKPPPAPPFSSPSSVSKGGAPKVEDPAKDAAPKDAAPKDDPKKD